MKLSQEQYDILMDWLERYLTPTKAINPKVDTSDIRKAFMDTYSHGFYLDNDTINCAMRKLGYRVTHLESDPYLHFNVSSQSPALREYHHFLSNQSTYEKYE